MVTGFGAAFISLSASSSLQQYFSKNRTLAAAFAMSGFSTGAFIYSPLARFICDVAGWRVVPVVMAGVVMQIAVLAMFLRANKHISAQMTRAPASTQRNGACCPSCNLAFGFHLLKIPTFTLFCVATTFFNVSVSSFTMHIVNKAIFDGNAKQTAALVPSIIGMSSFFCRIVNGFLTTKIRINKLVWYGGALIGQGTMLLVMTRMESFLGIAICSASAAAFISKSHTIHVQADAN